VNDPDRIGPAAAGLNPTSTTRKGTGTKPSDAMTVQNGRPRHGHRRPFLPRPVSPSLAWGALVVIVVAGIELALAAFIGTKGVILSGDEPSYIMQAQAYLHLSPQILSTMKSDLAAHSLSAYPVGTPISAVEQFSGPRGIISPFEPGLGILLVPFVAFGRLFTGALVGMVLLNTIGLVFLHRRVATLLHLRRQSRLLLDLLFATPALLLATTQIYPDLLSGILLACAVVEIALIEQRGRSSPLGTVVVTAVAAYLPWLQVKNFAPAIVLVATMVVVRTRTAGARSTTVIVVVVGLVAWGILLTYNHLYFGHLLGLPEPTPRLSRTGVQYTLGLLFDRDEGLFIQLPFAVVGLVGLWMARRKVPVAVMASLLSVGAILVLNGTYISNPYGQGSFAGRFTWTAMPVLVAWIAVVLSRWEELKRRLWAPSLVVAGAWIYQAVPILGGSHNYYTTTPPWDPAAWPGWWPGLDRALPQFDVPGRTLGTPSIALAVVIAGVAIIALIAWQYGRPAHLSKLALVATAALAAVVVLSSLAVKPLRPTTTLTYTPAQLGTPVSGHDQSAASPTVDLQGILPGSYLVTVSYHVQGNTSRSAALLVSCTSPSGAPVHSAATPLPSGQRSGRVVIHCSQNGDLATQFQTAAGTELVVGSLHLQSTST
jgi:hypothetical protein